MKRHTHVDDYSDAVMVDVHTGFGLEVDGAFKRRTLRAEITEQCCRVGGEKLFLITGIT